MAFVLNFSLFLLAFGFLEDTVCARSTRFLNKKSLKSYIKNPDEIRDYELFEPVIENGGRYRRSSDHQFATQVTFNAFGENYQLDLLPAPRFYRPDLEVEYVDTHGNVTRKRLDVDDCFYHGQLTSHNVSTAAVSICNGVMRGVLSHRDDTIYVTPLTTDHAQEFSKRYKRSSNNMHLIYRRNTEDTDKYCDVEPPPSYTAFSELTAEAAQTIENRNIPPKYLEMCVILDNDFVTRHTPDHEAYALTLLNIVSRRYSEPTLGVILRIYIVRIIVIASDTATVDGATFTIDNVDVSGTLASLRSWSITVNPQGDDDPDHWDNILTFSGKDLSSPTAGSGLLGLAYTAGTCSSDRGVSINEDFGLTTGIVAAHEVGHTLTLQHDQDGCDLGYVMGSSISNGQNIFKWSTCSSMNLKIYFSTIVSACLNDVPSELLSPLVTTNLPGETISWEEQCQSIGALRTCGEVDCGRLRCQIPEGCATYNSIATAEGTPCGTNMVCILGECVSESSVPVPVAGGWSEWTETSCSRTCGGGVIIRERVCNNPFPAYGGAPCEGDGFEPRLCNTEVSCTVSPDGYRDEQCLETANEPFFDGIVYGWTGYLRSFLPFTEYCKNPCFRSDNAGYISRPPGLNTDGTECWDYNIADESKYLRCVRGFCLTFGCDGVEGSSKEFDMCGICNGDGSSCTCTTESFPTGTTGEYNVWDDIPSGATSIQIINNDVGLGNNIAITGLDSSMQYFRGSGSSIDTSARAALGSFIILHAADGVVETFRSTGPSPESLRFEVYLTVPVQNLITYSYCLAKTGTTYFWDVEDYGDCTATCDGTQMRTVTCTEVNNFVVSQVDDGLCETNVGSKPNTVTNCNVGICPLWFTDTFGDCDATCGAGVETRTVTCRLGGSVLVDSMCDPSTKPDTDRSCDVGSCYWFTDEYGACSVTCGTGTQTRTVECRNDNGMVQDSNCNDPKPATIANCNEGSCPDWSIDDTFGECDATCGAGVETQTVTCRMDGSVVVDSMCDPSTKPDTDRSCDVGSCSWYTDEYGACSVTCGTGTQTRTVECRNNNGMVQDSNCNDPKPATTANCNEESCPDWSIDDTFGECDATCGAGVETQTVTCRMDGSVVVDSMCDPSTKPDTDRSCDVGSCNWFTDEYGACSVTCGTGTQTRTVECRNNNGMVQDSNCNDPKPATTANCNGANCPDWSIDDTFGGCDATCGAGVETQTVTCRMDGSVVVDSMCDPSTKPDTDRSCDVGSCSWFTDEYGACSVTCGTGTQTRTVECRNNNGMVQDSNCNDPKPATTANCNEESCPDWSIDDTFGECDATCGAGVETQTVTCRMDGSVVVDSMCDPSTKPDTDRSCDVGSCNWFTDEYGACSVTCGTGTQTRTVECRNDNGMVQDSNCNDPKPATTANCNGANCPDWSIDDTFGECDAICDTAIQTRTVTCRLDSTVVIDSMCDPSTKPPTQRICDVGSCRWVALGFGECSTTCGVGTQTRSVRCENNLEVVSDNHCLSTKPDTEGICNLGDCLPFWYAGPYGPCSVNCGKGIQFRELTCRLGSSVIGSDNCDAITRPSISQECLSDVCPGACDAAFITTNGRTSGTFQTPRFPRPYPRRSLCNTWIFAEEGKHIEISFKRFQLQPNTNDGCSDWLLITDLNTGDMKRYCGKRPNFRITYDHEVKLEFRSNRRRQFRGFRANFVVL
ncbi:A disintegrin and metalloproteinase with thrombospondin motifs 9-like isoform X2 [Apostichopus japonicus]|uniref:A disintegrin and metalloproteinase with thrombospondin motifs 9-like isoform X2 n=1 Tax=Stichopus japonicus TaxID=307972 RepID=UPI003AB5074B